jgi:hypothetical protein
MENNLRIILWHTDQGPVYAIHDVSYAPDGSISDISSEPASPTADSGQHLSNLMVTMMGAFREPVIDSAELHKHQNQKYHDTLTGFWDKIRKNS